jgi:type IV fimbrial biogenesis protein FimT
MKSSRGLTLVEVMVALVVATSILIIGIPAFNGLMSSNMMTGYANLLVGDLRYARSSATDSGHVTVCASNSDQTGCSGTDWNNGWLVFEDDDQGNDLDVGETILRSRAIPTDERTALVFDSGAPSTIRFDSGGHNVTGASLTLSFKRSDCLGSQARTITISVVGRPSVEHVTCF